jgi:hypothetical protein
VVRLCDRRHARTRFEPATFSLLRVALPYFEGGPLRWFQGETYTDGPPVSSPELFRWNHGLGEIVPAVIEAGLTVRALREHRECEWQALPRLVEGADGKFRLPAGADEVPLMFTLEARREPPRSGEVGR